MTDDAEDRRSMLLAALLEHLARGIGAPSLDLLEPSERMLTEDILALAETVWASDAAVPDWESDAVASAQGWVSLPVLELRRTFAVSQERLFAAFTDAEQLEKWWGPEGYSLTTAEIDLFVGGSYRFAMLPSPGSAPLVVRGVYREIKRPERLVFSWIWEGRDEAMHVAIDFIDHGPITELVLKHARSPEDLAAAHRTGWTGSLDRLTRLFIEGAGPD